MSNEQKIGDGGPAFPQGFHDLGNGQAIYPEQGMTLRDYLAAKDLLLVFRDVYEELDGKPWQNFAWEADVDAIACNAYSLADAMLAARSK